MGARGKENAQTGSKANARSKPILPGNATAKRSPKQAALPSKATVKPDGKAKSQHGQDQYEFQEDVGANEVISAAKKVLASSSKEATLRNLKHLVEVLEAAPQDASRLGQAGQNLAAKLLSMASDEAADKDVKLYSVQSMVFLLKMYAPDTPYSDDQLKVMFRHMLWALDRLSQPDLPTFPVALSTLHVTSETRLYLLVLDLEDPELVDTWISTLINIPRSGNLDAVEVPLQEVLGRLISEAGVEGLTDTVTLTLAKALAGSAPGGAAAQRLASKVLQRAESELRPRLQALLAEVIDTVKEPKGLSRQHIAPLLVQVQAHSPSVLLPLLPLLRAQLDNQDSDTRRVVAGWVTALLTDPRTLGVAEATDLVMTYLFRYVDAAADVRLAMLEATKQLVTEGTAFIREEAIKQSTDRLDDREERVRVAAVRALGEVAVTDNLQLMQAGVVEALMGRVLDRAVAVRRQATEVLVTVFRTVTNTVAKEGALPDSLPSCLLTIPARLAHAYRVDPFVRTYCHELFYHPGLLPSSGPAASPAGAALVWAVCWAETDAQGQAAVLRMLSSKTELAAVLLALLSMKQRLKAVAARAADDPAATAARDKELQQLRQRVSQLSDDLVDMVVGQASVHDRSDTHQKAKTSLATLLDAKDKKVMERLVQLASPALMLSMAEVKEHRKDLIERVGSKSPAGAFARLLVDALVPSILSPATLAAVAELALPFQRPAGQAGQVDTFELTTAELLVSAADKHPAEVVAAAAHLLTSVSKAAPSLLITLMAHMAGACLAYSTASGGLSDAEVQKDAKKTRKGKAAAAPSDTDKGAAETTMAILDEERLRVALRVMSTVAPHWVEATRGTHKLDALPPVLIDGLRRLCVDAPPKIVYLACSVLLHLSCVPTGNGNSNGRTSEGATSKDVSREMLLKTAHELASQAAGDLSRTEEPQGLAAAWVLCSIGSVVPDVFTDHALQLARRLVDGFLRAEDIGGLHASTATRRRTAVVAPVPDTAKLKPRPRMYQGLPAVQCGIAAATKGALVRAVAKAVSPQNAAVSAQTAQTVKDLVPVLEELMDVDTDLYNLIPGVESEEDAAMMRLSAARALLKLAVRHDHRLSNRAWSVLALTLQDPDKSVRACFGSKLILHLGNLHVLTSRVTGAGGGATTAAWLPSKYAAMLPLAAVEPEEPLRNAAISHLRSYCSSKRRQAHAAAQQAALAGAASASAGGTLQALPEFMIPYAVFLLAAHPDCPDPSDSELSLEDLAPSLGAFSKMLQMLLEPLILLAPANAGPLERGAGSSGARTGRGARSPVVAQGALANYPLVYKLLTSIRSTQMMDPQHEGNPAAATAHMRLVCDLGLAVTRSLVDRECQAAGLPAPPYPPENHPAPVVLPKALFDCNPDPATKGASKVGDHLPGNYQPTLDEGLSTVLDLHAGAQDLAKPPARKRKAARAGGGARARAAPRRQAKEAANEDKGDTDEESSEGVSDLDEDAEQTGRPAVVNKPKPAARHREATMREEVPTKRQPARARKPATYAEADSEEDSPMEDSA